MNRIRFLFQQVWYDLYTGFLMRPAVITLAYLLFAIILATLEKTYASSFPFNLPGHWVFSGDSSSAQSVLGLIAGSMITVVSIIYSVLVMSLTLVSMQFSPRVLHEFMRDNTSQNQLGIFIGTFAYCQIILLSIQKGIVDFVPEFSITIGVLLALGSLGYLIYFIHHIALFIQVNYLVNIIARHTEEVMDSTYPENDEGESSTPEEEWKAPPEEPLCFPAQCVPSRKSGYIQLINEEELAWIAKKHQIEIYILRSIGEFAVEGNAILALFPEKKGTGEISAACLRAFDIGPVRTMQQDIEFGIRQIVDVALKAISPAVNDPTTASTCIYHLGRIMSRLARKRIPPPQINDPATGALLLSIRRATFKSAFDLAFNQIRYYGRTDISVSTAIIKALAEIASSARKVEYLQHIMDFAGTIKVQAESVAYGDENKESQAQWEALKHLCEKLCAISSPRQ